MSQNKYICLYKTPFTLLYNLALSLAAFMLCRVIFLVANLSYFPDLTFSKILVIFKGGLLFDISAIVYTNVLYILLMAFPIHFKERAKFQKIVKWLFVITNGVAVVANLIDVVYFRFTARRTTASVFSEFSHENNISSIISKGVISNWYLTIIGVLLIWGLWRLYRTAGLNQRPKNLVVYYAAHLVFF